MGARMAGETKRRHRKLVTAMKGTFWRGAREWGAGLCEAWALLTAPFGTLSLAPVTFLTPAPAWASNHQSGPFLPGPETPAPSFPATFSPSVQPHRQRAHLVLGAGKALAHAPEELAEGGPDHRRARANRAAECAQQRPQVGAQRLHALLQHLGLGLRAVQSRAPEWAPGADPPKDRGQRLHPRLGQGRPETQV